MTKFHRQNKFFEYLSEIPNISHACKKVGISRNTVYRWYKDSKEFKEGVDKALDMGVSSINDLAHAQLYSLIKKGSLRAIELWLKNNDPKYFPVNPSGMKLSYENKKQKNKKIEKVPNTALQNPVIHKTFTEEDAEKIDRLFG